MCARATIAALIVYAVACQQAEAQWPQLELSGPGTRLNAEFVSITSVRVLLDGRVLVSDAATEQLLLADFEAQATKPVGRRGRGPNEYSRAPTLLASMGDSTLAVVRSQRRWLMLAGANVAYTIPPDDPLLLRTRAGVSGISMKQVLMLVTRLGKRSTEVTRDTIDVILVERKGVILDTVSQMLGLPMRRTSRRDPSGRNVESEAVVGAMPTAEAAILFPDEWLAIVRLDPFRVDWRKPDGTWHRGSPLPFQRVRVDARQKKWMMDAIEARGGNAPDSPESLGEWPEFMPPFRGGLLASPDGRLLVPLSGNADAPEPRYLVVNRSGDISGMLVLAAGERLLGIGPRHVVVTITDSDGAQRLRRHPWP